MNSVTVIIFLVRFAFSKYEHCQGKPMEKKKKNKRETKLSYDHTK